MNLEVDTSTRYAPFIVRAVGHVIKISTEDGKALDGIRMVDAF